MHSVGVDNPATAEVVRLELRTFAINGSYYISHGSGFFIRKHDKDYLITAYHVAPPTPISVLHVFDSTGKEIYFHIEKWNAAPKLNDTDIIAIEISGASRPLRYTSVGKASVSDAVAAIGYPGTPSKDKPAFASSGIIRQSVLFTTNEIKLGMSGGLLLNDQGQGVGVISAKVIGDRNGSLCIDLSDVWEGI